jgi:AcrR family transcriptional regulator
MAMDDAGVGLRERKRLATHRSIQLAALRLVAEHGLENLTIDDIGREADVSPRTFFNYFPSKEDALVGAPPTAPIGDAVERFVTAADGHDLLLGVCHLLTQAAQKDAIDKELSQLRRTVLKQYPHLFAMRITSMRAFEDELAGIIRQRLEHDGESGDLESRSRLAAIVSVSTMRHAFSCWASQGGTGDFTQRIDAAFDELKTLVASS